jgi:hypothetical protein
MYHHGGEEPNMESLHETREGSYDGSSAVTAGKYLWSVRKMWVTDTFSAEGNSPVKGKATRRRRGKRDIWGKLRQIGVVPMDEDDGSGPNLRESPNQSSSAVANDRTVCRLTAKDPQGYALPNAALAFIATISRQNPLSTKYFDGLFFPSHEKHEKDGRQGHICRVQMRITRDQRGCPVWVQKEKDCGSMKTGESYRRHLLHVHLATPQHGDTRTRGELMIHEGC